MPETSVFLSNENGMSGNFLSCIKGFKYRFEFTKECGISLKSLQRERASPRDDGGTLWFFWSYGGILEVRRGTQGASRFGAGSPISIRVMNGSRGLRSSHCRANRPHLGMCPHIPCSFPVATGISGLHSRFTGGVRPRSSRSKELRSPLELRQVSLGAN